MTLSKSTLEICCYSIQSVINAANQGANRVELCADLSAGGTTPSIGLIERVKWVHGIDVYVIIRPRYGDFLYTDDEIFIMENDISACEHHGLKGVVFGILKSDGSVDVERTKRLTELAYPMDVTFHRAIDMSNDMFKAIDDIYACGIKRILTSGGFPTAMEGIDIIKKMVEYAGDRVSIMAGSGVNAENIKQLYDVGVREFHSSATMFVPSEMTYRNPNLNMGAGVIDEFAIHYAGADKIGAMRKVIDSL